MTDRTSPLTPTTRPSTTDLGLRPEPERETDAGSADDPRPVVGITLFSGREGHKTYTKVQKNYVTSVLEAGGLPWLIPTMTGNRLASDVTEHLDAVILTGGEDVHPLMYGAEPRPELGLTDIARDRWEMELLAACEKRDVPILAICRGLQVMNVARGGTLYQDINAETESTIGHAPLQQPMESLHHRIAVHAGSLMATIFEHGEITVNSFHHQAVRDLGGGLTVSSTAADGVVEAVEDRGRRFFLGVQFHAEALPALDPYYLRIFTALITAARDHRRSSA